MQTKYVVYKPLRGGFAEQNRGESTKRSQKLQKRLAFVPANCRTQLVITTRLQKLFNPRERLRELIELPKNAISPG